MNITRTARFARSPESISPPAGMTSSDTVPASAASQVPPMKSDDIENAGFLLGVHTSLSARRALLAAEFIRDAQRPRQVLRRAAKADSSASAGADQFAKYDKYTHIRLAREINADRSVDDLVRDIEGSPGRSQPIAVPKKKRSAPRTHDSAASLGGSLAATVHSIESASPDRRLRNSPPEARELAPAPRKLSPAPHQKKPAQSTLQPGETVNPYIRVARATAERFERTLASLNSGLEKNRHRPGTQWYGMRTLRPENLVAFSGAESRAAANAMVHALEKSTVLPRRTNSAKIPGSIAGRFLHMTTALEQRDIAPLTAAKFVAVELASDTRADFHGIPPQLPHALADLARSRMQFTSTITALHALLPLIQKPPLLHGGIAALIARIGRATAYRLENTARAAAQLDAFVRYGADALPLRDAAAQLQKALVPLRAEAAERGISVELHEVLSELARSAASPDELSAALTELDRVRTAPSLDPAVAVAVNRFAARLEAEVAPYFRAVPLKPRRH